MSTEFVEPPIISVAIASGIPVGKTLTISERLPLSLLLTDFLNNKVPREEAAKKCLAMIGNVHPVDKLESIKTVMLEREPPELDKTETKTKSLTRPWTSKEDLRLLAAIQLYGLDSWERVAYFVGFDRNKAQCSQRWNRGLNPQIKKVKWTEEEEKKLIESIKLYGLKNWTKVARFIGERCDIQCRYHFKQMLKDPNYKKEFKKIFPDLEDFESCNIYKNRKKKRESQKRNRKSPEQKVRMIEGDIIDPKLSEEIQKITGFGTELEDVDEENISIDD